MELQDVKDHLGHKDQEEREVQQGLAEQQEPQASVAEQAPVESPDLVGIVEHQEHQEQEGSKDHLDRLDHLDLEVNWANQVQQDPVAHRVHEVQ